MLTAVFISPEAEVHGPNIHVILGEIYWFNNKTDKKG